MEASEITYAPDITRINDTSPNYKVIIIDSMAIVNAIPKTEIINTCNEVFFDQLSNMAGDYDEVKWVSTPLSKNTYMRRKRTKGKSTS